MGPESKLIVNVTSGSIICDRALVVNHVRGRMRGLLGRQSLPAGEGMLLQPAPSIHTAFMRFPIDAVFLDGALRVVKLVEPLAPWRMASARRARAVLELAAGEASQRGIEIGDQLGVIDERSGTLHTGGADQDANSTTVANDQPAEGPEPLDSPPLERLAVSDGDRSGEAIRVLVVGKDRRFRAVAAALLTRRGCAVMVGEWNDNVAELSRRGNVDVVVLDAGSSLTAVAREVAQIETLAPGVGVVVVGEEPEQGLSAMPVVAKWGSFDGLFGAIQQARASQDRVAATRRRAGLKAL